MASYRDFLTMTKKKKKQPKRVYAAPKAVIIEWLVATAEKEGIPVYALLNAIIEAEFKNSQEKWE